MTALDGDDRPRARRALIMAGAVLVSLAALGLALFLGAWAFAYRRHSLHEGRLQRMLEQKPTVGQVSQGLRDEGMTLAASDAEDATLARLFGAQPPPRVAEVRAKRTRWPATRIFVAGDLAYVVYFDADGKAADFSLLSR